MSQVYIRWLVTIEAGLAPVSDLGQWPLGAEFNSDIINIIWTHHDASIFNPGRIATVSFFLIFMIFSVKFIKLLIYGGWCWGVLARGPGLECSQGQAGPVSASSKNSLRSWASSPRLGPGLSGLPPSLHHSAPGVGERGGSYLLILYFDYLPCCHCGPGLTALAPSSPAWTLPNSQLFVDWWLLTMQLTRLQSDLVMRAMP